MKQQRFILSLFVFILLAVTLNFFYIGVSNRVALSNDYNIPIAKSYLNGTVFTVPTNDPYQYFPGASDIILMPLLYFSFPNLFGLFGWVVLFLVCKKTAVTFKVSPVMSFIFASAFSTTISVIRTLGDQSIDKWLCTWFLLSLILLEKTYGAKTRISWKNSLLLGLSLGMLIGTKYSGPLFFIALLAVYGKRFIYFRPLRFIGAFLIFAVTGLFWYIRNFILVGNPYYPANLPFFKGIAGFGSYSLWRVLLFAPKIYPDLVNAFVSEYLLWAFSGFVVVAFFISNFKKKKTTDSRIVRLGFLGLTTGIAALFLPITTLYKVPLFHTISDMRYLYSCVAVLMLTVFLIADYYKKNDFIATIALVNAFAVFSFIPYQPKILIFIIILYALSFTRLSALIQKIHL